MDLVVEGVAGGGARQNRVACESRDALDVERNTDVFVRDTDASENVRIYGGSV
jgi:hypothetical protein